MPMRWRSRPPGTLLRSFDPAGCGVVRRTVAASVRLAVLAALAFNAGAAAGAPVDAGTACRDAAAATLPAPARAALDRIEGGGRQLLALRGYLRARDLEARWSWDEAQVQAYQGSPEQQAAHAEVARVQARFAADNPGYQLHVNLQVRSLGEQLRKWNGNASVAAAAAALEAEAAAACARTGAGGFGAWLRGWQPPATVNLAAPGLSAHGQGRAYDFQVMRGPVLVAGTDSAQVASRWIADGWAARLASAVRDSGAAFTGPLRSPDEPWHYSYVPPAAVPPVP